MKKERNNNNSEFIYWNNFRNAVVVITSEIILRWVLQSLYARERSRNDELTSSVLQWEIPHWHYTRLECLSRTQNLSLNQYLLPSEGGSWKVTRTAGVLAESKKLRGRFWKEIQIDGWLSSTIIKHYFRCIKAQWIWN